MIFNETYHRIFKAKIFFFSLLAAIMCVKTAEFYLPRLFDRVNFGKLISSASVLKYRISKKCCPIFILYEIFKNKQDFLDIQYFLLSKSMLYTLWLIL